MKVTIVTISFNQAAFLRDCIESILGQDYDDLEYIMVDAGSTDGSREIIRQYAHRIAHMVFEPDQGPADGLNKGFKLASGDIFGYINADDTLLPGAVRYVAEQFVRVLNMDVMCGNGLQLDEHGRPVRKIYSTTWNLRGYAYGACNVVQQATFFRREIFLRSGGFNPENKICWDGELMVDMALAGAKISRSSEFLGGFRVYCSSITGSGMHKSELFTKNNVRITEKVLARPPCGYDKILAMLYRFAKRIMHPAASWQSVVWRLKKYVHH